MQYNINVALLIVDEKQFLEKKIKLCQKEK